MDLYERIRVVYWSIIKSYKTVTRSLVLNSVNYRFRPWGTYNSQISICTLGCPLENFEGTFDSRPQLQPYKKKILLGTLILHE